LNELSREGREEGRRKTLNQNSTNYLRTRLEMMERFALAIAFYLGRVFNHPNAWFMRATEAVSPSPGGEGRGEGGLQTKMRVVNGLEGKNFFSPSQPSRSSRDTQLSAT
jgi:hypothetical protein